jgi:murein DD-endopeptidase MepM/ murein hydrolase activator NlpD
MGVNSVDGADGKTPADVVATLATQASVPEGQSDASNATVEGTSSVPDGEERALRSSSTRLRSTPWWPRLSRFMRTLQGRLVALAGAVALGAAGLGVAHSLAVHTPTLRANGATMGATLAGSVTLPASGVPAGEAAPPVPATEESPARADIWRITRLSDDAGIALVDGTIARRSLLAALSSAGVARAEAKRVTDALGEVREVDRFGAKDTFVVASEKSSGHVVAFEVASSPVDVWQGREDPDTSGTPKLRVRKLDLTSEQVRVRKAVVVTGDLRAAFSEAGFSGVDDILKLLDDALDGHAELSDIRPGARLRLVATEERVEGSFVRWISIEAVEYLPASTSASPVRVYRFAGDDNPKHRGWYDAKGKQPYHGGWRSPVPFARVVSRFNPHRMHPVLHVVMPHNGVDFASPVGTPVYATAAGTVMSAGMEGPCGNRVEIDHDGGITSVYCHLSRFAAGLHPGQRVEAQQLIAYVGQTGRVTGPHLHFGIKRNGVFIDPMTLRLDGVRVVPRSRRTEFDRLRGDLDAELDAIPLPAAGSASPPSENAAPGSDSDFEEQ